MVYARTITNWKSETKNYFYATPVDEPKRTKLRVSEQKADNVFRKFCKGGANWWVLLNAWDRTTSRYFRKRIINHLSSITKDRDCSSCPIRFQCLTEPYDEIICSNL